jgi:hypothetical protein
MGRGGRIHPIGPVLTKEPEWSRLFGPSALPGGQYLMRSIPLLLPVFFALLTTQALAGLDISISAEIRLGRVAPPPPPEVVVIEEPAEKGPPPWAPAHGLRRNRAYYYYPGSNVYYRPADRMWIYLDSRDWRVGGSLPTGVRVDFERSVSLSMGTDKPYEFHDQVRSRYPAEYFGSKVRVKEKNDKPDKAHPDRSQESGNGKGNDKSQGKGKGKDK